MSVKEVESTASQIVLGPLEEELQYILGMPCFACGGFADLFRASGQDIKRKAEHEQAAVIYWMLGLYSKHGPAWREVADKQIVAMRGIVEQKKDLLANSQDGGCSCGNTLIGTCPSCGDEVGRIF